MNNLINRNELRRLEKAAREKDKSKLFNWAMQYTQSLDRMIKQDYELHYQDEIQNITDCFLIAVIYALYYSEETYINKDNIGAFMADVFATFECYRTGEYKPEEFKKSLKDIGIEVDYIDLDRIYQKQLPKFDTDLIRFLKTKQLPVITIIGSNKFKDIILQQESEICVEGSIVFTKGVYEDNLSKEDFNIYQNTIRNKILMSDEVLVVNKDNYIDKETQLEIEFAKKHNKVINYLESHSVSNKNQK